MISVLRGHVAAVVVVFGLMFGLVSAPVCAAEVRVAVASNFAAPWSASRLRSSSRAGIRLKPASLRAASLYADCGRAPFDVFLSADEEIRSV